MHARKVAHPWVAGLSVSVRRTIPPSQLPGSAGGAGFTRPTRAQRPTGSSRTLKRWCASSPCFIRISSSTRETSALTAGLEDDLAFARACHAELDVPFRAVPGNHDVGDNPWQRDDSQRITEPRLVQYRRYFGDDHWFVEAGRWMAIGYVPLAYRRHLMDLLGANLRLVTSGHVHQHRRRCVHGVEHYWAPSTAFVLPDHRQPRLGTKHTGLYR